MNTGRRYAADDQSEDTDGAGSDSCALDAFANAAAGTLARKPIDSRHVSHRQADFSAVTTDSQDVNRRPDDLPRRHQPVGGQRLHGSPRLQHHHIVPTPNGHWGSNDRYVCSWSVGSAVTVDAGRERVGSHRATGRKHERQQDEHELLHDDLQPQDSGRHPSSRDGWLKNAEKR